MALDVLAVLPEDLSYARWASDLTEQLASYNPPNPGTEDSWQAWAAVVASIPEVADLGVQNPYVFSDWRAWASAFVQALG